MTVKGSSEATIRKIRPKKRRQYCAKEKVWLVLEGLRADETIAEHRRRERISQILDHRWSIEFLKSGKRSHLKLWVRASTFWSPGLSANNWSLIRSLSLPSLFDNLVRMSLQPFLRSN